MGSQKSKSKLFIKLIFALVFMSLVALVIFHPALKEYRDVHKLVSLLRSLGDNAFSGVIYVLGYALGCVFFLPASVMTLAGGAVFGFTWGCILTVISANLGASLAFLTARYLGRGLASGLIHKVKGLKKFDASATEHGFRTILILRLIPLFPFNGINFGAGLSSLKIRDFVLGSLVGMLPGTVIYIYFAASMVGGVAGAKDKAMTHIIVSSLLILALTVVTSLVSKKMKKTSPEVSS